MLHQHASARAELTRAYETWREWTEREGDAIKKRDWPSVGKCQTAKRDLQSRILQLTDAARIECMQEGLGADALDREIRQIVATLISLETRNEQFLREQRNALEVHQAELEETNRNLRRLQTAYGDSRKGCWGTYS